MSVVRAASAQIKSIFIMRRRYREVAIATGILCPAVRLGARKRQGWGVYRYRSCVAGENILDELVGVN